MSSKGQRTTTIFSLTKHPPFLLLQNVKVGVFIGDIDSMNKELSNEHEDLGQIIIFSVAGVHFSANIGHFIVHNVFFSCIGNFLNAN